MTSDETIPTRLRAAAALVREARAATLGSDEPWRYAKGSPDDSVRTSAGWEVATSDNPNNLRWIALMGPASGEALAATFDAWAWMGEYDAAQLHRVGGPETVALADAILAGTSR